MCYRAQHLWQAAAKQSPCVPAAVSSGVIEEGTKERQELELAATRHAYQAGRWALQQAMLTLSGHQELYIFLEKQGLTEPLVSMAGPASVKTSLPHLWLRKAACV